MINFGLLGNNISYSYSKIIHEYVFKYYGYEYSYNIYDINNDDFDNFMTNLKDSNIKGINVTIPYKEKVIKYLDKIDQSAKALGNVNTIINSNGILTGYNTDYFGFESLLNHYNIKPNKNDNIYILGTGGAANTCYNVCLKYSNNIKFVSRTKRDYNIVSYLDLGNLDINYIINASPQGDMNHINDLLISDYNINKSKVIIDLIYNPKVTKLLEKSNNGYNGLIMLIYQALKADELFLDQNIDYKILVEKVGGIFE